MESDQSEISFATFWPFLLRHRRLALICALLGACGLGALRFFRHREYTAFSSFLVDTKNPSSSISGIAAEFGITGMGQMGSQSPQFFADLVTSPTVLRQAVTTRYQYVKDGKQSNASLVDIYDVDDPTAAERIEHAMKKLSDDITAHVSQKTGLVSLKVTTISGPLAVQISQQLLNQINAVNLQLRQSEAAADRQFAAERANELGEELRAAEDRMQAFMQTNRDYTSSARLQLEQQRLSREVNRRQDVYESMMSSYEQARIDAMRNSPTIEIVDAPMAPARPDPRQVIKWMLGGVILGLICGLCIGGVWDLISYNRDLSSLRKI